MFILFSIYRHFILWYNTSGGDLMKEAMIYDQLDNNQVQCHVCAHHCLIKENHLGICGVRKNIKGKLFALNYGKTISVAIDPVSKKPIEHYLQNTETYSFAAVGCNFKCLWCQNHQISQDPIENHRVLGYDIEPRKHVQRAIENQCKSISYTYTEPTIFVEYAYETMKIAHEKGLKNIWVSNGYMSKQIREMIIPYLDAINIDLKGFDEKKHRHYCGGKIEPIKENIKAFHQAKIHIEITTLVVPGMNDQIDELKNIAHFIADIDPRIPWHISRFFPAYKMQDQVPTDLNLMVQAKKNAIDIGLKYVYLGNVR